MKNRKPKVGDVFAVPLGNGEFAYTQMINNDMDQCYVIYNYKSILPPALDDLKSNRVIVLMYTIDEFVRNGRWPYVGSIVPPKSIKIPYYLAETYDGKLRSIVVDHQGNFLHVASEMDKQKLSYKSSFSPKALEDVVRYIFLGIGYANYMKILFYNDS